ncbi:MAG: CapA family protein [Aerococcaceae bacterium]|nr:CapA family protein [Aerococcaceae bacterium]
MKKIIALATLATVAITTAVLIVWLMIQSKSVDTPVETASLAQENSSESVVESSDILPEIHVPEVLVGLNAREVEQPYVAQTGELRLRSVGDLLIHDRVSVMADTTSLLYQQHTGNANATQAYDFMPMLEKIAPFTEYADITIANLEIPTAAPQFEVSGYPQFNAPRELLTALKTIGVDIVSNATNHTLDLFGEGVYASLDNLQEAELEYVGSYESWEDKQRPRIIEKNGIKLGFLAYSYGTNGIPVPEGEEYLISLLDTETMLAEVEALKPQVDAVVVTLQLGEEYDTLPNDNQRYVFQLLSDAGVSLILGGHPHVLQPIEWYNDGKTYAIYSQASFLSGQRELDNKQGGITEVTFKRQADGTVTIENPKFMPIFMLGVEAEKMYETVPLADYQQYAIPDGENWWHILYERMRTYTQDFQYINHLETQWTLEDQSIYR